ncbi:MAG: ATP-binding protein [Kofleriaceae bacterium]
MSTRASLDFTRASTHLAIGSEHGVHLLEIDGSSPPIEIPLANVGEVAAIGEELWVVAGAEPRLHRLRIDGQELGAPVELPGPGRLLKIAGHAPAACWLSSRLSMLVARGDEVVSSLVPGDPDHLVAVSSTRWILCQRNRIALRESNSVRWSTTIGGLREHVVAGAVLFDGRSAALLIENVDARRPRALLVLGLYEPTVQHRLTLAGLDDLRFAPLRGFALVRTGKRLLLIDLRFGCVVKEHEVEDELSDLAIDDTAQHIALRYRDSNEVVLLSVNTLFETRNARAARPEPAVTAEVAAPPTPPTRLELEEPCADDFHLGRVPLTSVAALVPRPPVLLAEREETIALLERYRALAAALAGRAVAYAWDQGRLAFPAEGALPFRTEVSGLLGRAVGLARAEVDQAEEAVTEALAAVREAELAMAPRVPPLEALANEFGLSTIAQLILIVVAAPTLWGELARLYAILANDNDRPICDELLVHQILGAHVGRHDVARQLDADAPLVRHGMIRLGEGGTRPFVALSADPIILRLLPGNAIEGTVDDVRISPAAVDFAKLFIAADLKDRIAAALSAPRGPAPRLVVRGRTGAGRHALLATLAERANRRLGVIDATALLRDPATRVARLQAALRTAHMLGLLPCLDGLETIKNEDQAVRDSVRDLLRDHPGPVAVRLPWDAEPWLAPGYLSIELAPLTIQQRISCWRATLAGHGLAARGAAELAARYSVGPGVIARVCAQVVEQRREPPEARGVQDPGDGLEPDLVTELDAAVRQHLQTRLTATASRVARLATWSRVVLPPDTLDSLLELIARIKHRRTVYETWGFDAVMSTSRGVTALFEGGPGTGKTLVAGAIASELGMDLYRVDVSRIMSKWIGETEQNLAKLFDGAEDGNAIILFDEADSLFAKRTEVRTSVDRYANAEVNYLLQRLDTFEGIAILTSNFGASIDGAFKRRLSFRLTFPFPDEEMREQLWKAHLPGDVPRAGEFDFATLARRYRLSGGYIRNAVLRAAFRAAEEHLPLTQDHLERAIRAEFREIGKLADSGVLE